jgi:triphosphoribosyl-dephospho-CoA synthase
VVPVTGGADPGPDPDSRSGSEGGETVESGGDEHRDRTESDEDEDGDGEREEGRSGARSPAANGELALHLEIAGTPKPGNVDRAREYPDLRFEHFQAGAVGARPGLEAAAAGTPVGAAFERAVRGMSRQSGGNTQFGALLLLVPLVRAAASGPLTRERAEAVACETTVADAAAFFRAFEHVEVAVGDPPPGADDLDVRRGADAVPAVEKRGVTLLEVLELGADEDAIAAEWVAGFPRTFRAGERLREREGPIADRVADAFLALLAGEPDTLVATRHGAAVASEVRERAVDLRERGAPEEETAAFADELIERGVNPGTTADLTAGGLFVALERGAEV